MNAELPTLHTRTAVDADLRALHSGICAMGAACVAQLARLLEILKSATFEALDSVIAGDQRIDALHGQLDEQALELLARVQPMARDLRAVLAARHAALDLERVGDHVKRMAKQMRSLSSPLSAEVTSRLLWFGGQAQALLEQAMASYERFDGSARQRAWSEDERLDAMYHELLAELLRRMRESPDWVESGVSLVLVAKSLERIGDHATNIAEEAAFIALGEPPPASR